MFTFTYPDVQGCTNDSSLYFIDEHNIKCIDLKTSNSTSVNMQTVKTGLVEAGAIDIDYRERMIYWSDNALWTINRMNLDTLKTEVIKVENNVLEVNVIDQQYLLIRKVISSLILL